MGILGCLNDFEVRDMLHWQAHLAIMGPVTIRYNRGGIHHERNDYLRFINWQQ